MSQYNSILTQQIIYNSIATIFFIAIAIAIGLFYGIDILEEDDIVFKNDIIKFISARIIPIALIIFGIWSSSGSIMDYANKDFKTREGVLETISSPRNRIFTEVVYFKDEKNSYELPKKYLRKIEIEKGNYYKFTYAKRTGLILDIQLI